VYPDHNVHTVNISTLVGTVDNSEFHFWLSLNTFPSPVFLLHTVNILSYKFRKQYTIFWLGNVKIMDHKKTQA
jgi:hypothetical protein